tara:strand:- start:104 stop:874 length:771 start_codon:yes stop_codon:yes gene_type:complete
MIKKFLKFFYRIFISINLDPKNLNSLRYLPKYLKSEKQWIKQGGKIDKRFIFLNDFESEAGYAKGEYFHQDLHIAHLIFNANPKRHIDVGSRIDGFVSHVAAFREIEVIDIRPLKKSIHKNIKFIQADLMYPQDIEKTDSLSCLHAIEHFGLGRYKDPIDINGHIKGIRNLISLLKKDGTFYLSFPVGHKDMIFFNAHRVFHPKTILKIPDVSKKLDLIRFDFVNQKGELSLNTDLDRISKEIKFGCGIYTFKKVL